MPFVRQQGFRAHEDRCVEQLASRASKRKTAVLHPAADLAQDQVHSAASLSIGQGNVFRGQENKDLYFPKQIQFFLAPRDVPIVKEGWACKGVARMKGGAFKKFQRDFLLGLFNNNEGPKIRERDGHFRAPEESGSEQGDRGRIHRAQSINRGRIHRAQSIMLDHGSPSKASELRR
jgi:hypothetical protein